MAKVIIYQNDVGGIAVITPAESCLLTRTIQEIAEKDVPNGKPFKIIESSDLPEDHTFFNAWEVDESLLTDGVGADRNTFSDGGYL